MLPVSAKLIKKYTTYTHVRHVYTLENCGNHPVPQSRTYPTQTYQAANLSQGVNETLLVDSTRQQQLLQARTRLRRKSAGQPMTCFFVARGSLRPLIRSMWAPSGAPGITTRYPRAQIFPCTEQMRGLRLGSSRFVYLSYTPQSFVSCLKKLFQLIPK